MFSFHFCYTLSYKIILNRSKVSSLLIAAFCKLTFSTVINMTKKRFVLHKTEFWCNNVQLYSYVRDKEKISRLQPSCSLLFGSYLTSINLSYLSIIFIQSKLILCACTVSISREEIKIGHFEINKKNKEEKQFKILCSYCTQSNN